MGNVIIEQYEIGGQVRYMVRRPPWLLDIHPGSLSFTAAELRELAEAIPGTLVDTAKR